MVSRNATETHDEQESDRRVGSTGKKTSIRRSWFDIMIDARKKEERKKQDTMKDREPQRKTKKGEKMQLEDDRHTKGMKQLINMEGGGRCTSDTNSNKPPADSSMVLHDY